MAFQDSFSKFKLPVRVGGRHSGDAPAMQFIRPGYFLYVHVIEYGTLGNVCDVIAGCRKIEGRIASRIPFERSAQI